MFWISTKTVFFVLLPNIKIWTYLQLYILWVLENVTELVIGWWAVDLCVVCVTFNGFVDRPSVGVERLDDKSMLMLDDWLGSRFRTLGTVVEVDGSIVDDSEWSLCMTEAMLGSSIVVVCVVSITCTDELVSTFRVVWITALVLLVLELLSFFSVRMGDIFYRRLKNKPFLIYKKRLWV